MALGVIRNQVTVDEKLVAVSLADDFVGAPVDF